jgi:hypothetical protein
MEEVEDLPAWMKMGVLHNLKADAVRRFRRLRDRFEQEVPDGEVSHRDWQ